MVVTGYSNCRDQFMRRFPRFYPDCGYEVMYLWQLVAETLVFDSWSDAETAKAEKEAGEQWKRLGLDVEEKQEKGTRVH